MYHIKNDKRSERSAELLGEALINCLEKKSFDELTVVDVQKEAGVGRTTFYRIFDNLTDVLAYLSDTIFSTFFFENQCYASATSRDRSIEFISCWMKNNRVLDAIVKSHRLDILQESHMKNLPDLFYFAGEEREFCIYQLTAIMTSSLQYWVQHGKKESAEELFDIIKASSSTVCSMFADTEVLYQ